MNWPYILSVSVCVAANASWSQPLAAPNAPISVESAFTPAEDVALLKPLGGTLFFDASERDRMDRARKSGPISVDPATTIREPSVINGVVKRSDGITTVWVDGAYQEVTSATLVARISSTSVGMAVKFAEATDNTKANSNKLQTIAKMSTNTRPTKRKLKPHNSNSRK
jgi:hypothetical protein